jgi:nitroreductase
MEVQMMKKTMLFLLAAVLMGIVSGNGASGLFAQEAALRTLNNHVAERSFIPGPIPRSQITQILNSGSRAPSARNGQPWHFTAVQNLSLGKQIMAEFQDGNVLIVVSAFGDGKNNGAEILDCGLAVANLYLAAQAIGLGSRIYTGPVENINLQLKEALSLPNGYSAVAVVRVGQINLSTDAVTTASPRKSLNSIVTYK